MLLDRRTEAAAAWAESISRTRQDAAEALQLLMHVELLIADGWPDVYANHQSAWIQGDADLLHAEAVSSPNCGICSAMTRTSPPEAA